MALYIVKPWYKKEEPPTPALIYGAEWAGTSDTSWARTDAAAGFTAPNPYYSGMSTTPSSPFDNIMPWSGMRRMTDASAGELVELPKFYYKLSQPNGVGLKVQISMDQFDGSSVDPMHMNRGDGVGERDYAYIGRYHCSTNDYKSTTGVKPKANITRATARTAIHNLGSNIYQMDFTTRFTLWLLYLVEFANWNSQAMIGYGCGNGASAENMGYTDTMPYHTGTTKSSRTVYGLGTQYRYIEGLWDNVNDFLDGCYYNSNGLNIVLNPGDFSDTSNGVLVGRPTGGGIPSALSLTNASGAYPIFIPSASSGAETTYLCDYWENAGGSYPCIFTGADYSQSLILGLFFINSATVSDIKAGRGARLMVLPPSRLSA